MEPFLEIAGTGNVQVNINNKAFNNSEMTGTYYLDSKLKVIVDGNGENMAGKMLHDFPTLQPGENTISTTGAITSFVIKYHKAYL